jgi:hypothetical protein
MDAPTSRVGLTEFRYLVIGPSRRHRGATAGLPQIQLFAVDDVAVLGSATVQVLSDDPDDCRCHIAHRSASIELVEVLLPGDRVATELIDCMHRMLPYPDWWLTSSAFSVNTHLGLLLVKSRLGSIAPLHDIACTHYRCVCVEALSSDSVLSTLAGPPTGQPIKMSPESASAVRARTSDACRPLRSDAPELARRTDPATRPTQRRRP